MTGSRLAFTYTAAILARMAPRARRVRQHYVVLAASRYTAPARQGCRLRRAAVVLLSVTLAAAQAAALAAGPAAAASAPLDLYVVNGGSDQDNDCRDSAHPCRTVQQAVDVASGSAGADRHVVINLGPGTFIPRDGGVHVFHGSLTSLAIVGAGAGVTTLRTPLPSSHEVVALTVAAGFGPPVRVESLRITGHGFDGEDGSGTGGSYVTAIKDAGSGLLHVADVRIDRLRGGQGAAGAGVSGGDGGSVYGIDRTGGPTEVHRTRITDLRGGDGAGARAAHARRHGGQGGTAIGINTDGALRVVAAVIGNLHGGAGGTAADGGSAYSAAVQGVAAATPAEFVDSELSGNSGGRGGTGLAGTRGAPGGEGGQGGAAVGVSYLGPRLSVETSTMSGHRGAGGGPGGRGGSASALLPGGAGGRGGDGGAAVGTLAATPDLVATTTLANSTLSGNRAGPGGAGGNGGSGRDERSGIGGDGGDGGTAAGAALLAGPSAALANSAVHLTAVANHGAPGGAPGTGWRSGTPGTRSETAAGLVSNAPTTLAASLLDNGSSVDCLLIDAPLVDAGWNLAADATCFRAGMGSRVVPEVGAGLAALADNGGLTRTLAVAPDSPAATAVAVVSGLCAGAFSTDQRGAPRPGRGGPHTCAAGAFEPS